jgi:DNA mismatch endonuclease (patch repair protein)
MDKLTPADRSANMRAIRSTNTKPELLVRKTLRALGFVGYRLHRRDLPGRPDIAFIGARKAIFVHGCFWHGHDCREGIRRPKSRQDYWHGKISSNQERDARNASHLRENDWDVLVVWDCEIKGGELKDRLATFMEKA